MPVVYRLLICLPYWPSIRNVQRPQRIRAPDAAWAGFLLFTAKRETYGIQDWKELGKQFRMTVTNDLGIAQMLFCFGVQPDDPFPHARQWICAPNKLVNQVTRKLQQWRSQRAQLFGVVSAFIELIKPFANCSGLLESQQLDFIEGTVIGASKCLYPQAPALFVEYNLISLAYFD
jgi:hypothetical protein